MVDSSIDKCYSIESDEEALSCIKDFIANSTGNCRPRLVLFTEGNCSGCKEEKEHWQADIDNGTIQEISLDSTEGLLIAKKNNIDFVPALVALDCHDNIILPSD